MQFKKNICKQTFADICDQWCPDMTLIKCRFSCFLFVRHPKIYLCYLRQKPLLVSFLYRKCNACYNSCTIHPQSPSLQVPVCMHAYVFKCAFRELHLYSKSSRQAGRVLAGPGAVKWALLAVLPLIGSTYPTLLSRREPKSHSRCVVLWNPISFHNFNG